jgi:DNA-binding NtrC family response regulator
VRHYPWTHRRDRFEVHGFACVESVGVVRERNLATILCTDAEPSTRIQPEGLLAELGHQPVFVTSVREGLQALGQFSVDLVVTDSRMPDATKLDLLDALRGRGGRIPVIIMTGYPSLQHAIVSMQHGAADYLVKPLSMETVRTAVTNALQVDRQRRDCAATRMGSKVGPPAIRGAPAW